jgi:predicted ArsR family transcriptional regulator
MNPETLNWLPAASSTELVYDALQKGPQTAKSAAKECGIAWSTALRALNELHQRGLTELGRTRVKTGYAQCWRLKPKGARHAKLDRGTA